METFYKMYIKKTILFRNRLLKDRNIIGSVKNWRYPIIILTATTSDLCQEIIADTKYHDRKYFVSAKNFNKAFRLVYPVYQHHCPDWSNRSSSSD